MVNTSATGGYLLPTDSILEDAELEDFFHAYICGITGMEKTLVRPAFQAEPPAIPDKADKWIAFHFDDVDSDLSPVIEGGVMKKHEIFSLVCSCYSISQSGGARSLAKRIRDNILIPQNNEALKAKGIGIYDIGSPIPVPVMNKMVWQYRVDQTISMRRCIIRNYNIETIESAEIQLNLDAHGKLIQKTIPVENE